MFIDEIAKALADASRVLGRLSSDRAFRRQFAVIYLGAFGLVAVIAPLAVVVARGDESSRLVVLPLALTATAVGALLVRWMVRYLNVPIIERHTYASKTAFDPNRKQGHTLRQMREQIAKMRRELRHTTCVETSSFRQTQGEILQSWKDRIAAISAKDIAEDIRKEFQQRSERALSIRALAEDFELSQNRLTSEVSALSRRGNLNLAIGVLATFLAIVVLFYIAVTTKIENHSWEELLPPLFLRLSVVVFTEVFAFFFLRLYRNALQEIKHFQNELTNVEMKQLALKAALLKDDQTAVRAVIGKLASTERNYILKKGETVIELEHAKLSNAGTSQALRDIAAFVHKAK